MAQTTCRVFCPDGSSVIQACTSNNDPCLSGTPTPPPLTGSNSGTAGSIQNPPLNQSRDYFFANLSITGNMQLLKASGQIYNGSNAALVKLEYGDRIVTGPGSRVVFTLPDGTTFTMNGNSEIVIDSFIYDTDQTVTKVILGFVKGSLRWLTGHLVDRTITTTIKGPAYYIGIRGTEFEMESTPEGSGFIKLYSGELEIAPYDEKPFILHAGEMITYSGFVNLTEPMPIQ